MDKAIWASLTVWGISLTQVGDIFSALGRLLGGDTAALNELATSVGIVVTAIGARRAIAKPQG